METTKDKIDKLLGISDGQTIDDALNELTSNIDQFNETVNTLDSDIKSKMLEINTSMKNNEVLSISDLDRSMKEVEDMIIMSKDMFKHIYENIISNELIDAELVNGVSKLMESIHINISEFISLYRDKQKFVDKIKLMEYQQKQRLEIMQKKHELTIELLKAKNTDNVDSNTIDVQGSCMYPKTQEEIIKFIHSSMTDLEQNTISAN